MSSILGDFWPKKWPTKKQWKRFREVLNTKEKLLFSFLILFTVGSFTWGVHSFYNSKTSLIPSKGGIYREGAVLSARFLYINPLFAIQNNIERDITEIVFDGLMRFNKDGDIIPHIASGYSTEDNKTFNVVLRDDIYWSDGTKLTADDIVFTVKAIQNVDFQSALRQQWVDVGVEKISNYELKFILQEPSAVFKENLTLKPIPKHIFGDDMPREFRDSHYNIAPVGTGPYRYSDRKESVDGNIEYFKLERNPYYFRQEPYLDNVYFYFFRNEEELLLAHKRGELDGFAVLDAIRKDFPYDEIDGFNLYTITLPRYFSVIFNLQSNSAVKEVAVRRALNYATNKEEILNRTLQDRGSIVSSPILPDFYNIKGSQIEHEYNLEKARDILVNAGFENGVKEQEERFSFSEELKENAMGDDVRNLQRCFVYLREKDEGLYSKGEVTGFYDNETKEAVVYFQEKYREEILDPHNFSKGTGMVAGSTNDKLNELCEEIFDETMSLEIIITTGDDVLLTSIAEILKEQWRKVGINVEIKPEGSLILREEIIRPRNFEALLFGTMLSGVANPLPLWHSTKIDDPGLNLSGYQNKEVDSLLEKIIAEEEERGERLIKLEKLITDDVPSIFLFNPYFNYFISKKYKGVNGGLFFQSSMRFENIDRWYVNTKRIVNK